MIRNIYYTVMFEISDDTYLDWKAPITPEAITHKATYQVTLVDPVLAKDGLDRVVTHIQGSIGMKNINISGTFAYQLIPKAEISK